jgi:hypothetical protein
MAIGNTISALNLQNPSIISTLLSTAPLGIKGLVECHERAPRFAFSLEDVDQLVDNPEKNPDLEGWRFGACTQFVLPAIDWWTDVLKAMSNGGYDEENIGYQPALERQKPKLLELLNDALCCYASAVAEDGHFCADSDTFEKKPATVELLRRYRIYTRAVCAVAKEAWPMADLDWLYKMV